MLCLSFLSVPFCKVMSSFRCLSPLCAVFSAFLRAETPFTGNCSCPPQRFATPMWRISFSSPFRFPPFFPHLHVLASLFKECFGVFARWPALRLLLPAYIPPISASAALQPRISRWIVLFFIPSASTPLCNDRTVVPSCHPPCHPPSFSPLFLFLFREWHMIQSSLPVRHRGVLLFFAFLCWLFFPVMSIYLSFRLCHGRVPPSLSSVAGSPALPRTHPLQF